jgi:hypothetical protein
MLPGAFSISTGMKAETVNGSAVLQNTTVTMHVPTWCNSRTRNAVELTILFFLLICSCRRVKADEEGQEEVEKELQEDEGEADHPFMHNHYEDSKLLQYS